MVVNFANADMVGHSGKIEPTDQSRGDRGRLPGQIFMRRCAGGGVMLVTADHGNAEEMIDPVTGGPHTAHTTNPVPFIVGTLARRPASSRCVPMARCRTSHRPCWGFWAWRSQRK